MCGISGFCSEAADSFNRAEVMGRMLRAIKHRGPDDEGSFFGDRIALGATRLSIIDVAGGHQPIFNETASLVLVCNGEIYNYRQLRETLSQKGHVFSTKTDIEVIVHLFEEYGQDCVEKLAGMFAFAIWNKRNNELFLARDRFGIKPLYYWHQPGKDSFVFASELDAVLEFPQIIPKLDPLALRQYCRQEYVPAPRSIIKDVYKLPAAHALLYQGGEIRLKQYWQLSLQPEECPLSEQAAADKLYELLKDSVARHLMSDVPWGIFLSGGIDSSTLVALSARMRKERIKTFSIGFTEQSFDESGHINAVAKLYNTEHHHCVFSARDLLQIMEADAAYLDEPFADGSYFPTSALARFTRQHVKVALSGEGADEIFAGYPTYQAHACYPWYAKLPVFARDRLLPWLAQALPASMNDFSLDFKIKKFISATGQDVFGRHLDWMSAFSLGEMKELFSEKMKPAFHQDEEDNYEDLYNSFSGIDDLTRVQCLDIKTYLQDDLLTKADRAGMAHGLELRVPFLDHQLVDFVMSLPLNYRFRQLKGKHLFRKAVSAILPQSIIQRPKKGFGMPTGLWLTQALRPLVQDIFKQGCILDTGWFNNDYVRSLLSEHLMSRIDHRKKIWTLVMLEMWLRKRRHLS